MEVEYLVTHLYSHRDQPDSEVAADFELVSEQFHGGLARRLGVESVRRAGNILFERTSHHLRVSEHLISCVGELALVAAAKRSVEDIKMDRLIANNPELPFYLSSQIVKTEIQSKVSMS